ncbi:patatin-like phospholipase family protein [Methyloprofundus sp.]|uniref:patatin-like phospholipase family protein n=1 Tax=Methyloprofundus sp. TaxID=2020875 RepID=UPI003D139241
MSTNKKSVSLILGSGGARGLAHIGVIQELEKNGYVIKSISGCSMGALIGGIYAIGKLDEFEQWIRALSKQDIFSLLDLSLQKGGLIKGDKIIETLRQLVGETLIENLPIPFTAVAADVRAEKEVWLNKGPLFDAIRASISLPLFFTPFNHNGVLLVDGGVLNPVPIAPAFNDHTDLKIAVNLGGAVVEAKKVELPGELVEERSFLHKQVTSFIDSLRDESASALGLDWGMYEVANQSFDAMQSTIARQKLAAYPPDVIIEIPRNACGTLEFDRAKEMIELGRETAMQHLQR